MKQIGKNYNEILSKVLQERYKHKSGFCYNNAFELLIKGEVDYIVIGYVVSPCKSAYRHAWGIKNGIIVDSSIKNDDKIRDFIYLNIFEVYSEDVLNLMNEYKSPSLIGYKEEDEVKAKDILRANGVIILGEHIFDSEVEKIKAFWGRKRR